MSVAAKPGVKVTFNNKLKKIPGAKQYGSYDTPQPEGGLRIQVSFPGRPLDASRTAAYRP